MHLHCLFIIRKGDYNMSPELLESWDEYSIDENPEGWEQAKGKALKSVGSDMLYWSVVRVWVDEESVRGCIVPKESKVTGRVLSNDN